MAAVPAVEAAEAAEVRSSGRVLTYAFWQMLRSARCDRHGTSFKRYVGTDKSICSICHDPAVKDGRFNKQEEDI